MSRCMAESRDVAGILKIVATRHQVVIDIAPRHKPVQQSLAVIKVWPMPTSTQLKPAFVASLNADERSN